MIKFRRLDCFGCVMFSGCVICVGSGLSIKKASQPRLLINKQHLVSNQINNNGKDLLIKKNRYKHL